MVDVLSVEGVVSWWNGAFKTSLESFSVEIAVFIEETAFYLF